MGILQRSINNAQAHVLIIGGGVTGLTTALELLRDGFRVTVVAKQYAPADVNNGQRITAQIAGALWEWPPGVCGSHRDETSLEKSKKWCMVAYKKYQEMSADPVLREATGVRMRMSNFFFLKPVLDNPTHTKKMGEIAAHCDGFRHDPAIINELGINNDYRVVDAYQHLAPVIDTDRYMQWLYQEVQNLGGRLLEGEIKRDLLLQEAELLEQYKADVIVNCTGLGAKELTGDSTFYPLRGALVRVINDGSTFPRITQAMSLSLAGRDGAQDLVFIVPRNDNTLILGGLVEPHQYDFNINLENYPPLKEMYERNLRFYPDLAKGRIDPEYPIAVGLRPFRSKNVRVERGPRTHQSGAPSRIVHSVGHGGAGFSLSYGCAEDAIKAVKEILRDRETDDALNAVKQILREKESAEVH